MKLTLIMKITILIAVACLWSFAQGELKEFEDKVSILLKKIMDSKHLMSKNESTLLEERLAQFDKVINSGKDSVPQNYQLESLKTEDETKTTAKPTVIAPVKSEVLLTKIKPVTGKEVCITLFCSIAQGKKCIK